MNKILILGNGLVSYNLGMEFKKAGHEVALMARSEKITDSEFKVFYSEITKQKLRDIIIEFKPAIVINGIGYKDVKACESERVLALQSNVLIVQEIIDALLTSLTVPGHFFHLSTDYVFDGNPDPNSSCGYGVGVVPQPKLFYSHTKVMAETLVKSASCLTRQKTKFIIIRTGGLFGYNSPLINSLVSDLTSMKKFHTYINVINSPTSFSFLCESIIEMAKNIDYNAITHVSGKSLTRLEFCERVKTAFDLEGELIPTTNSNEIGDWHLPHDISLWSSVYRDTAGILTRLEPYKDHYLNRKG